MATSLSILYLSHNEAHRVRPSLERAIKVADEIVCIDSGSTDGTPEIFKEYGARVFSHELVNWGDQRNIGLEHCTYSWVLVLDCDEVIDPILLQSILDWKLQEHTDEAFWTLHRVHYFMGKKMKFSGLQHDHIVRLIPTHTRYESLFVHEKVLGKGTLLNGTLHHYSYDNEEQWTAKMRHYAKKQAKDYDSNTGSITLFHTRIKPLFRFFKHFLVKGGIFDGPQGLAYSRWMYRAVLWRYQELKELRKTT